MREIGLHTGEVLDLLDQRARPILSRPQLFPGPILVGIFLNGKKGRFRIVAIL